MGKLKATLQEFKEFISKGNIIDMAVGVVIGNSFKAIVTSLVDNIIMPLVGLVLGGKSFEALSFTFRNATVKYGIFIQNVVDFLIVAVCMFFTLKVITTLSKLRKKKEEEEKAAEPPAKSDDVVLLEEIRDLLKEQKNS